MPKKTKKTRLEMFLEEIAAIEEKYQLEIHGPDELFILDRETREIVYEF